MQRAFRSFKSCMQKLLITCCLELPDLIYPHGKASFLFLLLCHGRIDGCWSLSQDWVLGTCSSCHLKGPSRLAHDSHPLDAFLLLVGFQHPSLMCLTLAALSDSLPGLRSRRHSSPFPAVHERPSLPAAPSRNGLCKHTQSSVASSRFSASSPRSPPSQRSTNVFRLLLVERFKNGKVFFQTLKGFGKEGEAQSQMTRGGLSVCLVAETKTNPRLNYPNPF
eukprot:c12545_g1_i3 orf=321-983(+)